MNGHDIPEKTHVWGWEWGFSDDAFHANLGTETMNNNEQNTQLEKKI
jgi:hypothetical protein